VTFAACRGMIDRLARLALTPKIVCLSSTLRSHGDQGPHYYRVGVRARARTALRGLRDPFDLPDRQRLARRRGIEP
jgi:hypothetical protein